jgi:hypothetical protein
LVDPKGKKPNTGQGGRGSFLLHHKKKGRMENDGAPHYMGKVEIGSATPTGIGFIDQTADPGLAVS